VKLKTLNVIKSVFFSTGPATLRVSPAESCPRRSQILQHQFSR